MTNEEAKRWLVEIGGDCTEAKEQPLHTGSVMVRVTCAGGGIAQRHSLFDDRLTGEPREAAIREAFVGACQKLKTALA